MAAAELVPWLKPRAIEERADKMRERANALSAPVDVTRIAQSLGIAVYAATFRDERITGMIRKSGQETQILVNHTSLAERARYTIAHELGHFDLHMEQASSFTDTDLDFFRSEIDSDDPMTKRIEVQANMFAAALLMPSNLVKTAFSISPHVHALAEMFFVSPSAMKFRIANLGLKE